MSHSTQCTATHFATGVGLALLGHALTIVVACAVTPTVSADADLDSGGRFAAMFSLLSVFGLGIWAGWATGVVAVVITVVLFLQGAFKPLS
jgi:hypothetical protein